jgi:hypothetical protein
MSKNAGKSSIFEHEVVGRILTHRTAKVHCFPEVIENEWEFFGSVGAGEGNRTLVISLEGCCSTIELHPQSGSPTGGQHR